MNPTLVVNQYDVCFEPDVKNQEGRQEVTHAPTLTLPLLPPQPLPPPLPPRCSKRWVSSSCWAEG